MKDFKKRNKLRLFLYVLDDDTFVRIILSWGSRRQEEAF